MDKDKYEILKQSDFQQVQYRIANALRSEFVKDKLLPYVVSIAALSVLMSKIKDSTSLLDYVEKEIDDETTKVFLKKVGNEYNKLIDQLSKEYDNDLLKAVVLFSEPSLYAEFGEFSTPEGVSQLAISLLDIKKDDIILDLGSGINSFLIQAALSSESTNLYGVEINTDIVIIANIRRIITELPIKVIQGNIISQDFTSLEANKVFSSYPLGMRLPSLQNYIDSNLELKKFFKKAKRTVSGDWIFNMAAYLNTKQPGKTVVLMTNAGTWNKPDEEYRKILIEEGIVEGVILLPERLLPNTAMSLTMMVLSQNNNTVRMVDASGSYTQGRRQNFLEQKDLEYIISAYNNNTEISKKEALPKIEEQEYILNPQRYLNVDVDIKDGIPLGDLCVSINRGAMIKSAELDQLVRTEETEFRYLMLQNIHDGAIDENLPNLKHIDNKYKKYCIKDRNIIISKISPFKVAMAKVDDDEYILANGNLYFIEIDEAKINPVFIKLFLQSEAGMTQLNRYAKGAAMRSISIQDLKKILIPKLPREKQDQLAEEHENLSDEIIVLQKQIDMVRDKKAKLIEGVIL